MAVEPVGAVAVLPRIDGLPSFGCVVGGAGASSGAGMMTRHSGSRAVAILAPFGTGSNMVALMAV